VISVPTILKAISIVGVALWTLLWLSEFGVSIWSQVKEKMHPAVAHNLGLGIIGASAGAIAALILFSELHWWGSLLLFCGVVAVDVLFFIWPGFGKGTFAERHQKRLQEEWAIHQRGLMYVARQAFGQRAYRLFFFAAFAFYLTAFCATAAAIHQRRFPVIKGSEGTPDLVVLRTYGDVLITARFDRSAKTVESTFIVRHLTGESGGPLTIAEENIAPLRTP